jgi:WD40 repeat protein
VDSGKELRRLAGHQGQVYGVAFSPDGKRVAAGGKDGLILLWDAATAKQVAAFEGHTREVSAIAFTPDGRRLVSCSYDHTARVWLTPR